MGANWEPNSTVTVTFFSKPVSLGSIQVSSAGTFAATVTVPCDAKVGPHHLEFRGSAASGTPAVVTVQLHVTPGCGGGSGGAGGGTGAVAPGVSPGVATTGSNISLGIIILLIMAVVGLAAFTASRRRKVGEGAQG